VAGSRHLRFAYTIPCEKWIVQNRCDIERFSSVLPERSSANPWFLAPSCLPCGVHHTCAGQFAQFGHFFQRIPSALVTLALDDSRSVEPSRTVMKQSQHLNCSFFVMVAIALSSATAGCGSNKVQLGEQKLDGGVSGVGGGTGNGGAGGNKLDATVGSGGAKGGSGGNLADARMASGGAAGPAGGNIGSGGATSDGGAVGSGGAVGAGGVSSGGGASGSGGNTGVRCGGLAGTACPGGYFCDISNQCGATSADALGTCQPVGSSLGCPTTNALECGCDGKTYLNACTRYLAGVQKLSDGACGAGTGGAPGSGGKTGAGGANADGGPGTGGKTGSGGIGTGGTNETGGIGGGTCPELPSCNWCGGQNVVDANGCVTGWLCANGADPCKTQPCDSSSPCAAGYTCSNQLCWSVDAGQPDGTLACSGLGGGTTTYCDPNTQYCVLTQIRGGEMPAFNASCGTLPACSGACSCSDLSFDASACQCLGGTGDTMVTLIGSCL
jgi:hypothetical protein